MFCIRVKKIIVHYLFYNDHDRYGDENLEIPPYKDYEMNDNDKTFYIKAYHDKYKGIITPEDKLDIHCYVQYLVYADEYHLFGL